MARARPCGRLSRVPDGLTRGNPEVDLLLEEGDVDLLLEGQRVELLLEEQRVDLQPDEEEEELDPGHRRTHRMPDHALRACGGNGARARPVNLETVSNDVLGPAPLRSRPWLIVLHTVQTSSAWWHEPE